MLIISSLAFNSKAELNLVNDSLNNRAEELLNKGVNIIHDDSDKAKKYIHKAIEAAEENENMEVKKDAYLTMAECFANEERYDSALFYRELFLELHNDLFQESRIQIVDHYTQLYADSVDYYKKEVLEADAAIIETRQRISQIAVVGIVLGVFLVAFIIWHHIIRRREKIALNKQLTETNNIINEQREEILSQYEKLNLLNEEIKSQNEVVLKHKDSIQDKNNQLNKVFRENEKQNDVITKNLAFAQQIQKALLPGNESLGKVFDDFFVFYQPKELVGGDFYWMFKTDEHVFIVLLDCTGHGIPGSIISILGKTLLDKAIIDTGLYDPAEILSKLHYDTINVFGNEEQSDYDSNEVFNEGMDIAICRFTRDFDKLVFAGAKRPLYIFLDNKLMEIKGDKLSIGSYNRKYKYKKESKFTNNYIDLNDKSVCYLFSDGFSHQMNPDWRKISTKKFKQLLAEIHYKPMNEQIIILENYFNNHKGHQDQIDDISILGIKTSKTLEYTA